MVSETLSASDFPIKSVKLYRSGVAEITRSFQIDSLRYQSTPIDVEITNLPTQLYSLRASLTGEQLALLDFHTAKRNGSDGSTIEPSPLERTLTQRRLQLQDERRLKQQSFDYLSVFMSTLAQGRSPVAPEPSQVVTFFDDYVTAGKDRLESVAEIDRELEEVEKQLAEETKRLKHLREKLSTTVCVTLSTLREMKSYAGEITLTYMVDKTSWKPKYELRTTTNNGSPSVAVYLHIRCSIEQDTGEDWDNAMITFIAATSSSHLLRIPDLKKVEIRAKTGFSLFGNANNPGAPGIFGSSNNANANNNFGQQQPQNRGAFGGGAFGAPAGGLFGGATNANANNFAGTSSFGQPQQPPMFGSFQQQQQQAPPLFGQTQQQPATAFGTFGAAQPTGFAQQQTQGTPLAAGLFGRAPEAPTTAAPAPPAAAASTALEPQPESTIIEEVSESAEELWELQTDIRMTSKDGKSPVVYNAPNKVSIPSDGRSHQVLVDIVTLEAKFMHIAVPSVDTRVFYCCGTVNNSEYDLIPGPIATFVDDKHVSDGTIRTLTKPQVIECCIGVDPKLTATYARNKTESMSTFADYTGTTATSYISTVTIKNAHPSPVAGVVVREALPQSGDPRFTVSLREPEGIEHSTNVKSVQLREGLRARWSPPFRGVGGHKEGRFEWVCEVPTGETTLKAVWEVSAPRNVVIEEVVKDPFGGLFGKKGA